MSENYQVRIEDHGRAGNVEYIERGSMLKFWWEFTMTGAAIWIPTAQEWANFCQEQRAVWAIDRRQEIVERIAEQVKEKRASSAKIKITDQWIELEF